jgi:cation diffusion facilitator family transporter
MASKTNNVLWAALGFNAAIAASKFVAAFVTGSSAMLSEALHSLVDTGNQAVLLHGMRRAARPPDREHPFGHSRELYFWGFVVAILLFSMGAGVSAYEGVNKLLNPHPIEHVIVNYVVLGAALAFELGSLIVAAREFNARRRDLGVVAAIRASKDPALFIVLLEDIAAVIGLACAGVGISIAHFLGVQAADGLASLAIAAVLAAVATFLSAEIKSLLIGEAASASLMSGVRQIIEREVGTGRRICHVADLRSMQLGPDDVLITASLDFADGASAGDVEATVARLNAAIKSRFPQVRRLYLAAQEASGEPAPRAG